MYKLEIVFEEKNQSLMSGMNNIKCNGDTNEEKLRLEPPTC